MPSAALHLTHVELLAKDSAIHLGLRQALQQELVYAHLGAIFPDLPFYTNIVTMMLGYWLEMPAEQCPFAQKLHRFHPDLFAWHFLTESRKDHILTRSQRLAILGGFFAHVALDIELHPLVNWCSRRDVMLRGGHESHHHRLTEKYHSLFFHLDLQGRDAIGTPHFFAEKSRLIEHPLFFRLHLDLPVVRWATDLLAGFFHESAPNMKQFARWLRTFRHFSLMVSLPAADRNGKRLGTNENRHHYFENEIFSFRDFWNRGYQRSCQLLNLAYEIFEAGEDSASSREAFLQAANIQDLAYPPEHHLPPLSDQLFDCEQNFGLAG